MTGYAEIQTAVQAMKLGALDYVSKPITAGIVEKMKKSQVGRTISVSERRGMDEPNADYVQEKHGCPPDVRSYSVSSSNGLSVVDTGRQWNG
jgi:DNA-binding NtrC family response regulator